MIYKAKKCFTQRVGNTIDIGSCGTLLLLMACAVTVSGTILSSVGYIFEGFSPYATLRFFEFSDKGWNISENCLRDMYNFLEGLKFGSHWAIKLYDASGYYGGGALGSASSVRIHNPHICHNLFHQYKNQVQDASWNFLANSTVVPFAVHVIVAQYLLEITHKDTFKFEKVQQLICFPSSCHAHDLEQVLEVYLFQSTQVVRNITYLQHRVLNEIYNVRNDTILFILIISVCSSISIYALFFVLRSYNSFLNSENASKNVKETKLTATKIMTNNDKCVVDVKKAATDTVDIKFNKHNPVMLTKPRSHKLNDVLNAVSLHNVMYNLFVGDVTSQTVISVIFTTSLMYEYLRNQLRIMSSNSKITSENGLAVVPLMHLGSFLIDIYFFLNGSKLANDFGRTFPCGKLEVFNQVKFVVQIILQKFLSFFASHSFCVFGEHLLDKYFHNKIALEIPSLDYQNCYPNVANIFYVDIFFPIHERCMPWSWYFSLEMHFFIFICFVLLLKEIHPNFAIIIITSAFMISTFAATAWEVYPHGHINNSTSMTLELEQFNLVFDNIWLRFAPYAFGICMGQILHRIYPKMKNIFVIIYGWIAYLLMFALFSLACWYGNNLQLFSNARRWYHATLLVAAHVMWCLILLWTLLIVESQFWQPLGNLYRLNYLHALEQWSPISLLIAPIIIKLFVFSADAPINSSLGQTFSIFVGYFVVTHFCAMLLYIFFDGLVGAILKAAMPKLTQ